MCACTCLSLNVVCFSIPVMHSKLEHTTCIGTIKLMMQQSIVYVGIYTLPTAIWKNKRMTTRHRASEIVRQKRSDGKNKKKNSRNKTPIRLRSDITQNESHEQFFCESLFLLADNKKRITDGDTTIIRTIIIILPTRRVDIHAVPGSVTWRTSAIYGTKIYVNTPTCTKQPYYTYNLCCLFPKHSVFLYSK